MIKLVASVESNLEKGSVIFEKEVSVKDGETSDWIALPDKAGKVENWLVSLIPSGTARIETTGSLRSKVIANTAIEYAWTPGDVSANTNAAFQNVSAVRVVSVTGEATIEVRVS